MTGGFFVAILLIGVPISFVLTISAALYVWLSGNHTLYGSYMQQLFSGIESYGLLAIPLFMLTGELMNAGGLTRRLVAMARVVVGGFRGGLAYINLVANMLMASIMGSAVAQIAVMSRVMVPEMEKEGYDRAFAGALTAAGGLLSPIIPPSMLFVIFGVLAQIAIGDLFIAGIIPGLLLAGAFCLCIAVLGVFVDFPATPRSRREEDVRAILQGLPAGSIPLVIIGGIVSRACHADGVGRARGGRGLSDRTLPLRRPQAWRPAGCAVRHRRQLGGRHLPDRGGERVRLGCSSTSRYRRSWPPGPPV